MTIHQAIASPGCGCDSQDMLHALISIDEALTRIAGNVAPVGRTEALSLDHAFGRILAQPVRSRSMAPAFDNAAMDGYAIATSALTGAGPWVLPVIARVPAGQAITTPIAGAVAARIFTGAPIPDGADTVVIYSVEKAKPRHVAANPRVALHFNTAEDGDDVVIFTGSAVVDRTQPPVAQSPPYLEKYAAMFPAIGYTVESYTERFSAPIVITLEKVRGF